MIFEWELLNATYNGELQENSKELTPEKGGNFKRVYYTSNDEFIKGEIILTASERPEFLEFYFRDTKQGEIKFDFYDCRIDAYRVAKFVGGINETIYGQKYKIELNLRLKVLLGNRTFNFNFNDDNAIFNSDNAVVLTGRY